VGVLWLCKSFVEMCSCLQEQIKDIIISCLQEQIKDIIIRNKK